MEEKRKKVEGIEIGVKAEWAQASAPVYVLDADGEWMLHPRGMRVADFSHNVDIALEDEEEHINDGLA